ncbi:MAG: hypothetical protein JSR89_06480 [Proteobacteria bacterium]|nr:hypothetical protein [Pseudomonadota bacterium]
MLTEKAHEGAHDRPAVVALGKPDFFEWHPVSAVARHTLSLGLHFDAQLAMSQHREMVDVYERAGVVCHWLDARPELKYDVFARDSSVMTLFGAVITMPQTRFCRGDYALTFKFYQEARIPISTAANKDLSARMLGIEVYDPDLSMFTLGGGGPHCLCQPLKRDPL